MKEGLIETGKKDFSKIEKPISLSAMQKRLEKLNRIYGGEVTGWNLIGEETSILLEELEVDGVAPEQFAEIDQDRLSRALDMADADIKERQILITKIMDRFKKENKEDKVVQRYFDKIYLPSFKFDDQAGRNPEHGILRNNFNICNMLSRGDLEFIEICSLDTLKRLDKDLDSIYEEIDVKGIEEIESKKRSAAKQVEAKHNKQRKKELVGQLDHVLSYRLELFRDLTKKLGIELNTSSRGKSVKNILEGLDTDSLKRLSDLYEALIKVTRKNNGDIASDEDMAIGLLEL